MFAEELPEQDESAALEEGSIGMHAEEDGQQLDPLGQARSQARQMSASAGTADAPTPSQIYQLRSGYSELLKTLRAERRSLLAEPKNDRLIELLEEANELHSMVQRTVDAALDARFMAASADLGAEKLHTLPLASNPFTAIDLGSILDKAVHNRGPGLLAEVGKAASSRWRGVVGAETIRPLLTAEQDAAKRKKTARRETEQRPVGPAVHPTVLSSKDIQMTGQRETTDLVIDVFEQLARLLATSKRLSIYQIICDPTSFARSVECLFYVSFLVADGRLLVDGENDADHIYISLNSSTEDNVHTRRHHRIVCLSMKEWSQQIKQLCITEPLIKL